MSGKQLQQCRQVLARLNVDLRLQQVCDAVTLQTETKPNQTGRLQISSMTYIYTHPHTMSSAKMAEVIEIPYTA